ncbi:NADH-quinone oxidoreductase subunit L [Acidiferrobacter sp.]|uniref:NADH-quinone oxidoreductase subunit L n=1 Tax=Acidiferrobacter sp. TaxID=1872107 RepID=UPI0026303E33|nr:NADH-quinone oxidoreductase subunit L [Acidiferrobacter sp.]
MTSALALYTAIPLVCLAGSLIAGFFGRILGTVWTHRIVILGIAIAFALSAVYALPRTMAGHDLDATVYLWGRAGGLPLTVGFLIDPLTALMMVVVTFVSLMVHIYTIGYMRGDPGYQRFFSYIALFTFAMLMLVMANNFLQLFFGWEGVGLVSYLLIGFWYTRESAIFASLKAFLVNRLGDFGFILGIAAIYTVFHSLDYATVFAHVDAARHARLAIIGGTSWHMLTVICILLFIGAMGKSAQMPLHVWLPDSMEGPTPISALIHAATMVTAGIFMVARMSPLFEQSPVARSVVLVVGASTAFFMALLGMVQTDIKRVIAYSTLSQLGYMTVALGASAYSAAIFHLVTHAFFKALLFLAAGSVIIALHHEQDLRKMGGLRRYMPITFAATWVGSLALAGIPPFAGFFSKDAIIDAVSYSTLPGAEYAFAAVLAGVFVTAFYTFRMLFLAFYGEPRMDAHTRHNLHESPWVVTLPLVLLAIPSVLAGMVLIRPLLFGHFFRGALYVRAADNPLTRMASHYHGMLAFIGTAFVSAPLYLALAGIATAWYLYIYRPELPARITHHLHGFYTVLRAGYGFDAVYLDGIAASARAAGRFLWRVGDVQLIDGAIVNGTARLVGRIAAWGRRLQSGYIYHYAFAIILGLFVLMTFFLHRG